MIKLGDIAKDTVTGYEGTVVCIATWLHGCRRITLQAKGKDITDCPDPRSFDDPQLTLLHAKVKESPRTDDGGPRPEPSRN